jgi:ABC-2 type transport system permease protein
MEARQMSLRGKAQFAFALQATNIKAALALRGSFLMRCIMMFLNNLIVFINWWIVLQKVDSIGGWKLAEMALLWGVVASAFGLSVFLFGGTTELSRVVADGQLDNYLLQPREPLFQIISSKCLVGGLGDFFSGILFLYLSGYLRTELVPLILLCIFLIMIGLTATNVIFHCSAFWINSAKELSDSLWNFLIAFSTYPGSIYRGLVRLILYSLLPAGFFAIIPVEIISNANYKSLLLLIVATIIYVIVAFVLFYLGLRRYESGSAIRMRI